MVLAVKDVLPNITKSKSIFNAKYRTQILAILSSHIITFVHGVAIGWLSPIIVFLQSPEKTPLSFVVSVTETSWMGACWGIGALLGNLVIGFVSEQIGRKKTMILIAFPIFVSWWLIYFAKNIWFLYAARGLAGWCGGALIQIWPLYASEIADNCVRGAMSTLLVSIWSFGILIGYILSSHLNYFLIPWIASIFPIAFIILMSFFPEPPQFLLINGKLTEAERSFRYYKRIKDNNDPDLQSFESLKHYLTSNNVESNVAWSDLLNRKSLKYFILPVCTCTCAHLCGSFSLTQYMSIILQNSGTQMDVNTCTIILGFVQIFASLLSVTYVDKFGRRFFMLTSILGAGLGWLLFGMYLYIVPLQLRLELSWPSFAFMIFILATSTIGLMSLFPVVVLEAFPSNIRGKGVMLTFTFANLVLIAQLKIYLLEIVYMGMAATAFLTAIFALSGFIMTFIFMEEKTSKEINYE